jgi:hypothetical protein
MNHEEELVKAFILPARQERYLEFLKTSKNRTKFIEQLAHFKHLNPQFAIRISGNQRKPAAVLKLLTAKGAGPNCWAISENSKLDGREMDLETALRETVGYQMGTFLSCVPGKLAYFEDEDNRYILQR